MATKTKPVKPRKKPNPLVPVEDYQPYTDYIMLEPEQEAEESEGGIFIPESARKFLNEGRIIKTGPDVSQTLVKGMYIVFDPASEYRLDLGDKKTVFVVKESNVILWRKADLAKSLFPVT